MVDFAELASRRKAEAKARSDSPDEAEAKAFYRPDKPAPPPPKPRAEGRDREKDLKTLEMLLDCDITAWEKTFVSDVLSRMKRIDDLQLSVKQAVIVDKLEAGWIENDELDPTPIGNPPAQYAKPIKDREMFKGFDDMDDDIPF